MRILCHGLKDEDFFVEFVDHRVSLGCADSDGIAIKAPGVSEQHAFLLEEEGELFIRDNGSSGGTFLNQKKVQDKRKVSSDDVIRLGTFSRSIRVDFSSRETVTLVFLPDSERSIVWTNGGKAEPLVSIPDEGDTIPCVLPRDEDEDIPKTVLPGDEEKAGPEETGKTPVKSPMATGERFQLVRSAISQYDIIKQIGRGGLTELYLAHDEIRYCVIKILLPEFAHERKCVDRFIRAARIAADIRDKGVIYISSIEKTCDINIGPYLVMEYADGGSLRDVMKNGGPIPEEQAAVIVRDIASVLSVLGRQGVVHRDIKPDNILFTQQGRIKVSDFEVAKKLSVPDDEPGMFVGTPAYMSPEGIRKPDAIDGRTDIYSLGVTFYEMLTGKRPFSGNGLETISNTISKPVPDPRKINPGISKASAKIIMKMMAKDPEDRFRNADELLEALDQAFDRHTADESAEMIRKLIAERNPDALIDKNETWHGCREPGLGNTVIWKNPYLPGLEDAKATCFDVENRNSPLSGTADEDDDFLRSPTPDELAHIFKEIGRKQFEMLLKRNKALLKIVIGETILLAGFVLAFVATLDYYRTVSVLSAPMPGDRYDLQIRTEPDSFIYITLPDGGRRYYSSGQDGVFCFPNQEAGQYSIEITKEGCRPESRVVELNEDKEIRVPLRSGAK